MHFAALLASADPRRGPLRACALAAITTLAAHTAHASCGLAGCPAAPATESPTTPRSAPLHLDVGVDRTSFDLEAVSGTYTELTPRIRYDVGHRLVAGGWLPLVAVDRYHAPGSSGIGNAVAFAEVRLADRRAAAARVGTQVEIPIGDTDAGIADDHTELLPYIALDYRMTRWRLFGTFGARAALTRDNAEPDPALDTARHGGDEHGAEQSASVLVVNPHGDTELLYRAGIGRQLGAVEASAYVDGQELLDEGAETSTFVSGGAALGMTLDDRYSFRALIEVPFTSDPRFDLRAGTSVGIAF